MRMWGVGASSSLCNSVPFIVSCITRLLQRRSREDTGLLLLPFPFRQV